MLFNGAILEAVLDIRGGVETYVYKEDNGDIWTLSRQLPFIVNGEPTPLGRPSRKDMLMALIRATCQTCVDNDRNGDIELRPREVLITLGALQNYTFRCPVCTSLEIREANDPTIHILIVSGCRAISIEKPIIEVGHGAHFTDDDSISFHEVLEYDEAGWMAGLMEMVK